MEDLTGKVFGQLTVIRQTAHESGRCTRWLCQCSCGNTCEVSSDRLRAGKKTHCGCRTRKDAAKKDITGQKFHMLTALYETDRRDRKGSVIWRCKCDCGNEVDVSYDRLNYSTVVSCGCRKKEFSHKLNGYQTHVAGTSVNILSKKKLRTDNKTGVAGVYLVRGRYRAEICFQQKSYYLGEYAQLETAAAVRQEAEKLLHGNFLSFYEKWKKKAEEDPEWAKENPISVSVKRDGNGDFIVSMLPSFEQEKGTTA